MLHCVGGNYQIQIYCFRHGQILLRVVRMLLFLWLRNFQDLNCICFSFVKLYIFPLCCRMWKVEANWQRICRKWSILSRIISCRVHGFVLVKTGLCGYWRLVRRVLFTYECKRFTI